MTLLYSLSSSTPLYLAEVKDGTRKSSDAKSKTTEILPYGSAYGSALGAIIGIAASFMQEKPALQKFGYPITMLFVTTMYLAMSQATKKVEGMIKVEQKDQSDQTIPPTFFKATLRTFLDEIKDPKELGKKVVQISIYALGLAEVLRSSQIQKAVFIAGTALYMKWSFNSLSSLKSKTKDYIEFVETLEGKAIDEQLSELRTNVKNFIEGRGKILDDIQIFNDLKTIKNDPRLNTRLVERQTTENIITEGSINDKTVKNEKDLKKITTSFETNPFIEDTAMHKAWGVLRNDHSTIEGFEQALEICPRSIAILEYLASISLISKKVMEVHEYAKKIKEIEPGNDSAEYFLEKAKERYWRGRFSESI